METAIIHLLAKKEEKKTNILPSILFLLLILYLALLLFGSLSLAPFCITYKGSCFLLNEATCGRYANEIMARGLEWDTIYPKS